MIFQWQHMIVARMCAPSTMTSTVFIVAVVLWSANAVTRAPNKINYRQKEKEILDHIFGSTYDKKIRPSGLNETGPTEVNVNFYLRSIDKIDDYNMEISVQITFREKWYDDRLRFNTLNAYKELNTTKLSFLTLKDSTRIWMPDLFFSNERQGQPHNLLLPNVYFRIYPDGEVLYSIRLSLTLSCPMIFKLYPLDKQSCSIRMASYKFTTENIIFKWKKSDPVQVSGGLHISRFTLLQFNTKYCDSHTNTGTYSCILVDLQFKREFSYYFIQFYIPCIILVIASWISFWLDESAAPERASLGVTVLLTMVTQISGINENLPPVSYTKALDVWTAVCLTFVFGALLEFAVSNYFSRTHHLQKRIQREQRQVSLEHVVRPGFTAGVDEGHSENESTMTGMSLWVRRPNDSQSLTGVNRFEVDMEAEPKPERCAGCCLSKYPSRSKRIDVISRIIFPFLFALFNIAYWYAYLSQQDKTNKL